ncbi:alginate lyase family protein [Paenibacillus cymbidii]|uniref:alginate lyase family protein n=1 Tax=Paenibacillus cymbidii TaxID=1639034 RepID=UPI001080CC97|nr:alginate lyase family protein [Paenibacillus cymbidii]
MNLQDVLTTPVSKEQFYEQVKRRLADIDRKRGWTNEERAAYIRAEFPQEVEQLVQSANEAVQGNLHLPGSPNRHFVGNPPDWFADPFFDAEYVVGLNRMGHWNTLAKAYLLTGDRRYAEKVIQEAFHWIAVCPYPGVPEDEAEVFRIYRGIHPWNALSSGIRMFASWPTIVEHLFEFLTPDSLAELVVSIYKHGELLAKACPILHPKAVSNHYIMENTGLLYLSFLFPELRSSQAWIKQAMHELERCAAAQMTNSGGHIEGNPSYHSGCLSWLSLPIVIAGRHGLSFSDDYTKRVAAAVEYAIHAFRPTGTIVPWGDSDANLAAVYGVLDTYPAFGRLEWIELFAKLAGKEQVWGALRGNFGLMWQIDELEPLLAAMKAMDGQGGGIDLPMTNRQYELHQFMMRTSWEREALSVFFTCRTPVEGGHSHQDPTGFDFTAYGRPLVVDPGRFCYREDEDRRLFKSATWHNTLTINHREPYDLISSWRYGPQKPGVIEAVYEADDFTAVAGMHRNYEPVIHRRLLAMIEQRFLLVLDSVASDDPVYSVQLYYHFDSLRVEMNRSRTGASTTDEGQANVLVHTSGNLVGELLAGKVSDHLDQSRPSTRMCLRDYSREHERRAYATLIVPSRPGASLPETGEIAVTADADAVRCSFRLDGVPYQAVWQDGGLTLTKSPV